MRKPIAVIAAAVLCASVALPALASSLTANNSELLVGKDGVFIAKHLLLYQKSGSALYSRAVWGSSFVRMTVLISTGPGTTTQLIKAHGGTASLDDFKAGDYLDVEGTLQTGADTLLINATKVTDGSANLEQKTVSGTIKSVGQGTFTLTDKTLGTVTVTVGNLNITKGVRTITAAELAVGDKITSASGTYDYASATLTADKVVVFQNMTVFAPRNFMGTIKSIAGTALPATMVISTSDADYQVFFAAGTKIYSKNYANTSLNRFAVGDQVRFYGSIRQDNLANVDATILRDLNF